MPKTLEEIFISKGFNGEFGEEIKKALKYFHEFSLSSEEIKIIYFIIKKAIEFGQENKN